MSSQGPNKSSSAISNSAVGASPWNDPENCTGNSDSSFTGFDAETGDSEYLDVTNFGFSIPVGSTGINFTFEVRLKERFSSDDIFDKEVRFLKAGTAVSSDVKNGSEWPTTFTYRSYLSSSDTNGTAWSSSDMNHSAFGIRIQAAQSSGAHSNAEGQIEHVRCTVNYTPPAGGVFSVSKLNGLTHSGKEFNRLD